MKLCSTVLITLMLLFPFYTSAKEDGSAKREVCLFMENKGQLKDQNNKQRDDILYYGASDGLAYYFKQTGISYQLYKQDEQNQILVSRIDMSWVGANPNARIISSNKGTRTENFYKTGQNDGITGVQNFGDLTYKNIYNNVDLHFYYKDGSLKYDFIVAPHTDYKSIKINIGGASSLKQNKDGTVSITTPYGTLTEGMPVAFQGNNEIKTNWTVEDGILSFQIDKYDASIPLIIDPLVYQWQSNFGGGGGLISYTASTFTCIVNDASGNTYGALSNKQSAGGSTPICNSSIIKYDNGGALVWYAPMPTSSSLVYSVNVEGCSLGGNAIYACGSTSVATNIATTGAYQTTLSGSVDGFLAKYDINGNLIWRTYYGGSGSDSARSCKADNLGNVYVTGLTHSSDAMASLFAYQGALSGLSDAFVVKFDSTGMRKWGTYYGGPDIDGGQSIDVKNNKVFVTGYTKSISGIALSGAQQSNLNGTVNGFLLCLDTAGVALWGTYYGSDSTITEHCVATDNAVYICGTTKGATNISTPGSFQPVFAGDHDGFAAKFNINGVRQWGTYYGGTGYDNLKGNTIGTNGTLLLCGSTTSTTGISTPGSYNPNKSLNVTTDPYLVELDTNGVRFFGTYNNAATNGFSCSSDGNGSVFIAGNGHQANSNYSGFIAKFNYCNLPAPVVTASPSNICSNVSSQISTPAVAGATYQWFRNDVLIAGATSNVYTTSIAGNYKVMLNNCPSAISLPITLTTTAAPNTTVASTNAPCPSAASGSITITPSGGTPPYSYSWNNSANTTASLSGLVPGSYIVHTSDANTCMKTDTVIILNTMDFPVNQITETNVPCYGAPIGSISLVTSGGTAPYSYTWDNSTNTTAILNGLIPGTYIVHTSDSYTCVKTDTIIIGQNTTTAPSDPLASICAVTVDSATGKNLIIWEKNGTVNATAYNIYREGSAGEYNLIGTNSVNDFSTFLDATSIPLQQSYNYKIAEVDSCNHEWPESDFHKTIHLSANIGTNGEVNLSWNQYEGKPYTTHDIMRSFNGGPFTLLNQVSSTITSYSDLTPPTGNSVYRIEIDLGTLCSPSKPTDMQRIKSNVLSFGTTGVNNISKSGGLQIAPNPTKGVINILGAIPAQIRVYDAIGKLMLSGKNINKLDIGDLTKGIYMIYLSDKEGLVYYSQKLVLN